MWNYLQNYFMVSYDVCSLFTNIPLYCLFKCETAAERFLTFLNQQHPNIKFTIEKKQTTSIFRYFK